MVVSLNSRLESNKEEEEDPAGVLVVLFRVQGSGCRVDTGARLLLDSLLEASRVRGCTPPGLRTLT